MSPFDDVKAGSVGEDTVAVDVAKVEAAARFVPYKLKIVRYFDLTGEGHGGWDQGAQLTGAVVLPRELVPQKWGAVKLEEVKDEAGNDLLLGEEERERYGMMRRAGLHMGGPGADEDEPDPDARHVVRFGFKCPEAGARRIERIRGAVELQYFSGKHIVKIKDAVAADRIQDASKMFTGATSFGEPSDRELKSDDLDGLGVKVSVMQAVKMVGMTMLMLQAEEKKSTISDAQVYDAHGTPWQCFCVKQGSGRSPSMIQLIVPGSPEPPLSLAFVAAGGGKTVRVPISLDGVPIRGKERGDE
jgi:hypothetical protein